MEAITNAVSSAAATVSTTVTNTIYGTEANETGGTEPVSGQKGAGTASDPYDKGNDETATSKEASSSSSTDPTSTAPPAMASAPTSNPAATGPELGSRPDAGSRPGDVRPTEANANDPTEPKAGGFGTAEPSVSADPASAPAPEAKQQGAEQPLDEPKGDEVSAIKEQKEAGEDGQKHPSNDQERQELAEKGQLPHDPNDHSGEPMKMHGGGASDAAEGGDAAPADDKAGDDKPKGQEGGGEHGKEEGTGEQWVKTSGFEKDGGDFDATKPGAGREATRLVEQAGGHHETGAPGDNAGASAGEPKKEKVSTMDKIKDKLHLGTGKNLEGGK